MQNQKRVFLTRTSDINVKPSTPQSTDQTQNAELHVIVTSYWAHQHSTCSNMEGKHILHSFAVHADTMAAAIRFEKQKLFLLLSTLYQQWLQKATGARMYCALFEQGPGEKFKDSWKDSHSGVRGLDPTLGECVTDRETARACLQAVTLFAPTVYSSRSSLKSDLDHPKQSFLSTTVC